MTSSTFGTTSSPPGSAATPVGRVPVVAASSTLSCAEGAGPVPQTDADGQVVVNQVDPLDLLVDHVPAQPPLQLGGQCGLTGVTCLRLTSRRRQRSRSTLLSKTSMTPSSRTFIATSSVRSGTLIPLMRPRTSATK